MEYDYNSIRFFLDLCNDAIIIIDSNLIIKFINESTEKLFDYESTELCGKCISCLIEPINITIIRDYILNIKNYLTGVKNNNTTFKTEILFKYYKINNCELIGCIIKDVSTKDIISIEHDKFNFLSSVSHEFRTPVNGIIGLTDILIDVYNLPSNQKEHVMSIKECANSLKILINDIRDFSLITAGKLLLQYENININLLIFEIHKLIVVMNRENTNIVVKEIFINDDNINYIVTDYQRSKQVILNLVSNAFKFTDNGTIIIIYTIIDKKLKFSVRDTGIGINKNKKDILFKMFSRIDNSKKKIYAGTGLGLAISKNIVKLLRGTIDYISVYGEGSIFFFEIPLSNYLDNDPKQLINKKLCGDILLVEDNKINVLLAKRAITSLGLNVDVALNGLEAIELIINKNNDYALIFMDINMPYLNGLETTIKLREKNIKCPIIGLSGSINENEITECIEVGMNDYLSKPFNVTILEKMLRKWL